MQELKLILAESDSASLVLRGVESGEDFFLPVTEELCSLLSDANPEPSSSDEAPTLSSVSSAVAGGHLASVSAAQPASEQEDTEDSAAAPDEPEATVSQLAGSASAAEGASDSSSDDATAESDAESSPVTGAAEPENKRADWSNSGVVAQHDVDKKRRHRIRINMSPRTIQDRVRHGASIAELAQEADTDEARIEPYAWPILQERARIAELARASHPVTGEGPSKQTLWEVLATALAARGSTVSDTEWVAYQDPSRRWVIAVRWEKEAAGQVATHEAEFLFEESTSAPSLAHPLNSVASDLIDPRYGQPVRRISAVTPLLGSDPDEDDFSEYDEYDDNGNPRNPQGGPQRGRGAQRDNSNEDREGEDFLLHPSDEQDDRKTKRKRKAVTPHWEDVLLGVRTNPRKKK